MTPTERHVRIVDATDREEIAVCSLASFLESNETLNSAEVIAALDSRGVYEVGGGAAPAFVVDVMCPVHGVGASDCAGDIRDCIDAVEGGEQDDAQAYADERAHSAWAVSR
jgi:hypothetical protein